MGKRLRRRVLLLLFYTFLLYLLVPYGPAIFRQIQDLLGQQGVRSGFYLILIAPGGFGIAVAYIRLRKALPSFPYARLGFGLLFFVSTLFASVFLPNPAEKFHLLQYGIMGGLFASLTPELAFLFPPPPSPRLNFPFFPITGFSLFYHSGLILLGGIAGLGEELIQAVTPHRYFEWRDVMWNLAGVFLGYGFTLSLLPSTRWSEKTLDTHFPLPKDHS